MIPVSMLAVKLGKTLAPDSLPFAQAEQAIWSVSARARSLAGKTDATDWAAHDAPDAKIPEAVKSIVLEAAYRLFKNPNRYVMNQAFQFTGQISHEMDGDIFLAAERTALERFNANGMWVQGTYRDQIVNTRYGYVSVEGSGEPFPYYGGDDG